MHYVALIFDETNGKIAEARAVTVPGDYGSIDQFTRHIGYIKPVTTTLYKAGDFTGCKGRALTVTGPYDSRRAADVTAANVTAAANAVDIARFAVSHSRL